METDLVILCPDGAWPQALRTILSRPQSLRIRPVTVEFIPDPLRDSSPQAVDLLRPFQRTAAHALIVRDFHGSGWERKGLAELERVLRLELASSGWNQNQTDVLIADPEIEGWLRLDSDHVHTLLQERARRNRNGIEQWRSILNDALASYGGVSDNGKAKAPKEVFHELLKHYGIPPSNSLFQYLGNKESLKRCVVPSYLRFLDIMQGWFPAV